MATARLTTLRDTEPSTSVTLHPAWSVTAEARVHAAQHRTRAGHLYTYVWGGYGAWRVPLRMVSADLRTCLQDWWREGMPLLFTLDESLGTAHAVCRIVNAEEPLVRLERPFADRFAGVLELAAVDARTRLGRAFILDHAHDGRLDQPTLSLP